MSCRMYLTCLMHRTGTFIHEIVQTVQGFCVLYCYHNDCYVMTVVMAASHFYENKTKEFLNLCPPSFSYFALYSSRISVPRVTTAVQKTFLKGHFVDYYG
jgi:hypothetical protein